MEIKLVIPTLEHKQKAIEFKQEFFDHGENVIDGSERLDMLDSYEEWLDSVTKGSNKATANPDWVVFDTYFAFDENNEIIGIIDFRHELKGFLVDFGHTGYSVRPTMRNKGYAKEMLRLVLLKAKKLGYTTLQFSVLPTNIPSVKTIKANGGVYERSFDFNGMKADVYLIHL